MKSIESNQKEILLINKSKFISFACPIKSENEANDFLTTLRREYDDATHICYAFVLSSPSVEKCSDDGEPSQTAGKPILEVIKKKGISNVLVAVVRYFGGIKLGAGGLVRAYTNSAKLVLDKCNEIELVESDVFEIVCDLEVGAKVLATLKSLPCKITSCEFSVVAKFTCVGNINGIEALDKSVKVKKIGREMVCLK